MELLVNGVGDAFSVKHWGTSFVVREGDFHLAIDCPDSYRRALTGHQFPLRGGGTLDVDHLDALFLTHLHGDHVNGLEMTLAYRMFVSKRPLTVYTTPEVADQLWSHRLQCSLGTMYDGETFHPMTFEAFGTLEVVEWGQPSAIGPLQVHTRKTLHHIPTAALRVSSQNATWGYSCDTAFDPTLIAWLSDADFVVHESAYGPAHTPLSKLEALPASLREKLMVVHYPDDLDTTQSKLRFGREGETVLI